MSRITLTKKQADDLQYILNHFTPEEVLQGHLDALKENKPHKNVHYQFLNDFSIVQISKMLFEGYDIKKEPRDIIIENYKIHAELLQDDYMNDSDYHFSSGYIEGIKSTLKALDIRIEAIQ